MLRSVSDLLLGSRHAPVAVATAPAPAKAPAAAKGAAPATARLEARHVGALGHDLQAAAAQLRAVEHDSVGHRVRLQELYIGKPLAQSTRAARAPPHTQARPERQLAGPNPPWPGQTCR